MSCKGDVSVKKKQREMPRWLPPTLRLVAACAVAVTLCALPLDWQQVGQTATLLAAGLQQPQNAAQVLSDRLEQSTGTSKPAQSVQTPTNNSTTASTEKSTASTTAKPADSVKPPAENGSGGKIYEKKLDTGDTLIHGIALRNSSGKSVNVAAALNTALAQRWENSDAPQVLIVHTHTTEGYMRYDAGYYNSGDRDRTTDRSRNVCAAGDALVQALAAHGITAIHDTSVHDSPQYSGAYGRSAKTVQSYLDKYPSIRVVLDLHRDAVMEGANGLVKPTVTIDEKKAAQVMIIAGVVSTDALPNPHWEKNLALAAQWQKLLTERYDGLMRPLSTVGSRYNQHLHAGYLLVEVGSEGNTVDEAVYSAQLLGTTLAELLK